MSTMMALRAHRRGGAEVLVYEPAPMPQPGSDEVLVAVHAAAITFTELGWEETWTRNGEDRTPIIPSHEFSGTVAELGDAVTDLRIGDEVYGLIRFDRDGAAAEYVTVPAADLAAKPATVSHESTAALPLAALTAWQALVDHAHLRAGEKLLVHGGAGGVGAFVVQLAAALGGRVEATARGADVDFVRTLGASRVFDFEAERFDAEKEAYDVVVDPVGGDTLDRSFVVLRRGGRLVTLLAPPSQEKAREYGVSADFFIVAPDRDELTTLARLLDGGRLRVTISQTFPLSRGREAFEAGATRTRTPGKTVLTVR